MVDAASAADTEESRREGLTGKRTKQKGKRMSETQIVNKNVDLSIDKNDVLAIAVSRAEAGLIQTVEDYAASARETDREIAQKLKELEKTCEANLPDETASLTKTIPSQLSKLGAAQVWIHKTIERNGKSYRLQLVSKVSYGGNVTLGEISFTFEELKVAELDQEITALEEKSKELKIKSLEARKRLSNISTLERAVRGRLAEARLREFENGEEVIRAVLADLDLNVKALPSF